MRRRTKSIAAIGLAGSLLTGTAAAAIAHVTKSSLPARTSKDISALIAREQAVISTLQGFARLKPHASASAWEAKLKATEHSQTTAIGTLNHDLVASTQKKSSSVLSFKDLNGNPYNVALLNLIDPAHGADQFTTPNAGMRFVAALFRITDTGTRSISDDANSNASLIGSNDQTYSADFDSVAGCTNFNSGEYQLAHGESATGCVVFQVPLAVKVKAIVWSPSGGFGGAFGRWNIVS